MPADAATRRAFTSLVAAACVDRKLAFQERTYLARKASEFGIPPQEADEFVQQGLQGAFTISVPPSPAGKQALLDELLEVICADGRVEPQERALLLRFGMHLGVEPAELGTMLRDRLNKFRSTSAEKPAPSRPVPAVAPPPPMPVERRPSKSVTQPPTMATPQAAPAGPRTMTEAHGMDSPVPVRVAHGDPIGMDTTAGPNLLALAPGPIKLQGGPGMTTEDLPPITRELVRNVIRFDGRDPAIAYVERTCSLDKDQATKAVDRLLAEDSELIPGGQRVRNA